MKNLIDAETTDLVELLRNGSVGQHQAPEQEVYFDAGYTPPPTSWKIVKEEWITIDGVRKKYICYS